MTCLVLYRISENALLQILGSIPQDSLFNLTVKGYKGGNLIFTNTTTVSFSPRNVSTFIQTDKSSYQPGDTVKVRIVSVQLDNNPYKGRVDISAQVGITLLNKARGDEKILGGHCMVVRKLTEVLLSHAGSHWESCQEVGVHRESGDCVAGFNFIPDSFSWTVVNQNHSECKEMSSRFNSILLKRLIFVSVKLFSPLQGVSDETAFIVEHHGNRSVYQNIIFYPCQQL